MRTSLLILLLGWLTGCGQPPSPDVTTQPQASSPAVEAATATEKAPEKSTEKTDELVGKWEITSLLKGGQEAKPPGSPIMIEFRDGWQYMTQAGAVIDESKYSLNSTTSPKSIDSVPNARTGNTIATPGIYEVNGDVLRLCMGSGSSRPMVFESTQEYNLIVLKRAP